MTSGVLVSKTLMLVFWVVTPCEFAGRYQSFMKINAVCSSETLVSPTSAHGIATQKTNIKIVLYVNNCKYGDDAKVRYVTSHNFNVVGIFTNKNYSQKWMTNLCNYEFIVTGGHTHTHIDRSISREVYYKVFPKVLKYLVLNDSDKAFSLREAILPARNSECLPWMTKAYCLQVLSGE
jgi:hypothetical protein